MNLCSSKDDKGPNPNPKLLYETPFSVSAIPLTGNSFLCPDSVHNAGQSEILVLYELLCDSSLKKKNPNRSKLVPRRKGSFSKNWDLFPRQLGFWEMPSVMSAASTKFL